MTDEIKIWALDGSSEANKVTELEPTNRTETEQMLEDTLVANPEMLMPGLKLVGRQTSTTGGPLDLLGVDSSGQLVVFELKRGTLTRDAITQIIDYASSLELLSDDDLAAQIAEQSGKNGIDPIDDFEEWYSQRFAEQQLDSLKPIQMMLVGLGADKNATRMVDFLTKRGVDISLLTFHGYSHAGKTLLAKQVQVEPTLIGRIPGDRRERLAERERDLIERAEALEIRDFFEEVVESFRPLARKVHPRKYGYTFYQQSLKLEDRWRWFNGSYAVLFTEDQQIRITFYPVSIHLCEAEFSRAEESIPFVSEPPPNAPLTQAVTEQRYCLLDRQEWEEHKGTLLSLASAVYEAWNEALRNNG